MGSNHRAHLSTRRPLEEELGGGSRRVQKAAGRATAARGPGRQPEVRRWRDLLRVEQLLEALARSLRQRAPLVVLDINASRRAGRRLIGRRTHVLLLTPIDSPFTGLPPATEDHIGGLRGIDVVRVPTKRLWSAGVGAGAVMLRSPKRGQDDSRV